MIKIVKKFENYTYNIKDYIDNSNYKTKFFIELLDLSNATFYRKIKEHSFTISEIVKLTEVLFPKEFYDYQLTESIRKGREDYKNGKVTDASQLIEALKEKFL
jgi:hypothetical protein